MHLRQLPGPGRSVQLPAGQLRRHRPAGVPGDRPVAVAHAQEAARPGPPAEAEDVAVPLADLAGDRDHQLHPGGDVHHAKSIYRLISIDSEEKQFGLGIVRVRERSIVESLFEIFGCFSKGSGGLSDVLSWVCDKIRVCEMGIISKKLFDRELNVLVRQQLACEVDRDLLDLIEYLFSTQCKTVRVFDEDDDLSLSVLEAIVTSKEKQKKRKTRNYFEDFSESNSTFIIVETAIIISI